MEAKVIKFTSSNLLPPPPGHCQQCAMVHAPNQPHNLGSLFYRMKFRMDNGREATWYDALEHCPDDVQAAWLRELRARGAISD
jgi:hypothetical protein